MGRIVFQIRGCEIRGDKAKCWFGLLEEHLLYADDDTCRPAATVQPQKHLPLSTFANTKM